MLKDGAHSWRSKPHDKCNMTWFKIKLAGKI